MNVVVTAGGTSERIDSVRKITNSSSGKLGSIIANKLLENSKISKIFYVCNKEAVLPVQDDRIEIINIQSVDDLQNALENLIKTQKISVVIHSMAVSDYKVEYVTTTQNLSTILKNKDENQISDILSKREAGIDNKDKISSNLDNLFVKLVPTPKVISKIKQWDKDIFLIGFKLLSNVSHEQLIDVAINLMQKNNCDAVVANDLKDISKQNHKAYILTKDNRKINANTKTEIAQILYNLTETIQ